MLNQNMQKVLQVDSSQMQSQMISTQVSVCMESAADRSAFSQMYQPTQPSCTFYKILSQSKKLFLIQLTIQSHFRRSVKQLVRKLVAIDEKYKKYYNL